MLGAIVVARIGNIGRFEARDKLCSWAGVARKLLTLVYYGLRYGEIHCLARANNAA